VLGVSKKLYQPKFSINLNCSKELSYIVDLVQKILEKLDETNVKLDGVL
jgi:hypothetical protein